MPRTCTQALHIQTHTYSLGPLLRLFYPSLFPGPVHYLLPGTEISALQRIGYRSIGVPMYRCMGTPISLGSLISFHTYHKSQCPSLSTTQNHFEDVILHSSTTRFRHLFQIYILHLIHICITHVRNVSLLYIHHVASRRVSKFPK